VTRHEDFREVELRALTALLAALALALAVRWVRLATLPPPGDRLEVVSTEPLDLNAADLDALTALAGVGRVRAARLLGLRPLRCWHQVEAALGAELAARVRAHATLGEPGARGCPGGGCGPLRAPRSSPGGGA